MKKLILTYGLVLMAAISFAQNSDLYAANKAYEEGLFEEAEMAYSKLVADGYYSTDLYYNLGNTYYQLGDIGKSIWAYEKALKIDPSNEDAQFNLDFVNTQTIDQIDNERPGIGSWFKRLLFGPNINLWPYLSLVFSLLFGAMLVLFFKTKSAKRKNMSLLLGSVFGLGLIFSFLVSHYHSAYFSDHSSGVIITEEVEIKLSPLADAVTSFPLHAGSKVAIVGQNNEWLEVEVNGNSGWLLKEDLWEI